MKNIVLAIAVLISLNCSAAVVYNATIATPQVTMDRDALGVSACGIRATVAVEVGTQMRMYDLSGSVYRKGMFGLWKAGSYSQDASKLSSTPKSIENALRVPAPSGFWIATDNENAPVAMEKIFPSNDRGFTLGGADFIGTMRSILDIAKGNRAQFSMAYKNEKFENIISFASPLSEIDYKTLLQCFDGLHKGLESDGEKLFKK